MPKEKILASMDDIEKMEIMRYELLNEMYSMIRREVSSIDDAFSALWREFMKHKENHLPNPESPSSMKKALEALGLSEDYEVEKRKIMATVSSRGNVYVDF